MEWLYSELVVHYFFILSTIGVCGVVLYAYVTKTFPSKVAWVFLWLMIAYMTSFLLKRYATGHMEEHMERESAYIALAAFHGILSIVAIVLTIVFFYYASKAQKMGTSFFREHVFLSLLLPTLWGISLISGFLI